MQMSVATDNYNNMDKTVFVGMDVHKESFTLCSYTYMMEKPAHIVRTKGDYKDVLKYIEAMKKQFGEDAKFVCGYEAGCLGYTLYRDLKEHGVECVILAPTTMPKTSDKRRKKNDARDSIEIAQCMAYRTCSFVFVPDDQDVQVKEYIRMRNCHKKELRMTKQQLLSFCLRLNIRYGKKNWTQMHIDWLRHLELNNLYQEILTEYLITLERLTEKIARLDLRISEIAASKRYAERVNKLKCFRGIQDYIALATIVEVGDFERFPTAERFAAFIGLTPGEYSSGESISKLSITKAGNSLLRALYTEAAHCCSRGRIGYKSKEMKRTQKGQPPEYLAYADKANERMHRKYYHLTMRGKHSNTARSAIARELCCFIWGAMTNNIA